MSTGLHAAREDLHLPHISSSSTYLQGDAQGGPHGALPKPLSLSPRTFGMEDLRDFCGPLGSFKTGLTPRVFSTGLTPRSGFTPRFTTGFTPRMAGGANGSSDTNSFFSRNMGFSPPRQGDAVNKISPTGFTPKDVSGMKVPMRFPGTFTAPPQKMEQHMAPPPQMQHKMHSQMPHMPQHHHHHQDMNHMNMSMYDYLNRPTISHPHQSMPPNTKAPKNVSPVSDNQDGDADEVEDLDERRRMKNRERVRKCRKRKQDRLNFLEDRTAELEKENSALKAKLARKTGAFRGEQLTEAQIKEVRKTQNTTLAAYIRAYNESADGDFAAVAKSVWSENAEIVYGNKGMSLSGLNAIVANKLASTAVFGQYKIKNYSVQWKENAPEKCLVHWEIEVFVKPEAPLDVPLASAVAEMAAFYREDELLTIHMISHVTFDDGKIVEEIRQMNLAEMAASILSKFAQEPTKASEVLRSLMSM